MSKLSEQKESRRLREMGFSISEIAQILHVSKSSASLWTRGIKLTSNQQQRLIEKGEEAQRNSNSYRVSKIKEEKEKRRLLWINQAKEEWESLSSNPGFLFGLALYIGEGNKVNDWSIGFTNGSVAVLKKALEFFNIIGIDNNKLKAHVGLSSLHQCSNAEAEYYWSKSLELPLSYFYRTTRTKARGKRKSKSNQCPFGCCQISFNNTELKTKLKQWMEIALEKPLTEY